MTDKDSIVHFKECFFRSPKFVHLNNAGIAPINKLARDTVAHWANRLHEDGVFAAMDLFPTAEKAKENLAKLVNAPVGGIAFFQGAANAISQVAFGLDFKQGDEVVVWDQEYPSNFYPWRDALTRSGGKFVLASSGTHLATPVDAIKAQVTAKTKVIAVSWVQYQTGAITDLKELTTFAKSRGILTVADIIQGVGQLPFDFMDSGLDFAIGGSHKWLTSPIGVGYLIAREETLGRLKPQAVGAFSYGTDMDLARLDAELRTGAARLEPGSRPMIEQAAFGASLQLFLDVGISRIAQEAEHLAKRLGHGLRERGYEVMSPNGQHQRGAIVTFKPGTSSYFRSNEDLEATLKAAGISFAKRFNGVRLSPHAFNLDADIETTLRAVSP